MASCFLSGTMCPIILLLLQGNISKFRKHPTYCFDSLSCLTYLKPNPLQLTWHSSGVGAYHPHLTFVLYYRQQSKVIFLSARFISYTITFSITSHFCWPWIGSKKNNSSPVHPVSPNQLHVVHPKFHSFGETKWRTISRRLSVAPLTTASFGLTVTGRIASFHAKICHFSGQPRAIFNHLFTLSVHLDHPVVCTLQ